MCSLKGLFSHSVEPTQSTAKTQAPDKPAGECVVFENTWITAQVWLQYKPVHQVQASKSLVFTVIDRDIS